MVHASPTSYSRAGKRYVNSFVSLFKIVATAIYYFVTTLMIGNFINIQKYSTVTASTE